MTTDPSRSTEPERPKIASTFAEKVVLIVLALIVLAVLAPVLLWTVGYGLIPLWHWGTSWIG